LAARFLISFPPQVSCPQLFALRMPLPAAVPLAVQSTSQPRALAFVLRATSCALSVLEKTPVLLTCTTICCALLVAHILGLYVCALNVSGLPTSDLWLKHSMLPHCTHALLGDEPQSLMLIAFPTVECFGVPAQESGAPQAHLLPTRI
jgi:hypothetical protein